jgi:hypothetical protein
MDRPCCFQHLVLTAPSPHIALLHRCQLQSLQAQLVSLRLCASLHCVSDPHGFRVGSGGGTLNALSELQSRGVDLQADCGRVLIVHSGGDSKRAPLHSVCGKAWMPLNGTVDGIPANPLILLIKELSAFLQDSPSPSIVVACSDVLLSFSQHQTSLSQHLVDGVYVVTMPAPLMIARNHGVIVHPSENAEQTDQSTKVAGGSMQFKVGQVHEYLQKPSITEMEQKGLQEPVCIDSGVLLFLGSARFQLLSLLQQPHTFRCTTDTLDVSCTTSQVLRFELYSELLLACAVEDRHDDCNSYLQRINIAHSATNLYRAGVQALYSAFNTIPLCYVHCLEGSFRHLGTSEELQQMLLEGRKNGAVNICSHFPSPSDTAEASNAVLEYSILPEDCIPYSGVVSHCDFSIASLLPPHPSSQLLVQQLRLRVGQSAPHV